MEFAMRQQKIAQIQYRRGGLRFASDMISRHCLKLTQCRLTRGGN